MVEIDSERRTASEDVEQGNGIAAAADRRSHLSRLWRGLRHYPVLLSVVALLLVALALWVFGWQEQARLALLATILVGGLPLLWITARQVAHREISVDLLALLAIAGSAALGQYLAGAIIVLMLSGGEALEAFALHRARSSLTALAERAPRHAHLVRGDELVTVAAEDVDIGMEVAVKPGELFPVDGVVTDGVSSVSEADLTGEPVPVLKEAGALVLSGSVNLDAVLRVRATKRTADSQYALIVRLVAEAQERKAPLHRLADRYALWFTALALGIAGLAWAFSGDSLYALAVLVVATPCPLILATPIAIMSGVDRAARSGIIVKSGATIEQLGEVDVAVFDKTGTLTLGTPALIELAAVAGDGEPVAGPRYSSEVLLALAASVEQFSSHILARAVVTAARERGATLVLATDITEATGKGVRGLVPALSQGAIAGATGRIAVAVGNRSFMGSLDISLSPSVLAEREHRTRQGQMVSFLAIDGRLAGLLIFSDVPRPELARLAPELKAAGIERTVLLTGDGEVVARQIGTVAGIDRVVSQCLPEDKVRLVTELEQHKSHVLMVGDGINDAPALATATVGIAMGAQGLTAASSAADAVLLSTDIVRVADAVRLGRQVVRVAKEGIWVGIGLSIAAMVVAAFGYLPPAAGAILQEGIDVLVILNALRAGRGMEGMKDGGSAP